MEDMKINVKIKISLLWVAVMFCYAYADILAHMRSDILEQFLLGAVEGIRITPLTLLGSAILMVIPIVMIFLSLALKAKVNRWADIIIGVIYSGVILLTMLMTGGGWLYYYIFAVVEFLFTVLIVWYAWKWTEQEAISLSHI